MPEVDPSSPIHQIILAHARIRPATIEAGHVLTRDLGFDSLAFLLALTDLEERIGFHFPLERVDELAGITVGEFFALVGSGNGRPSC